MVTLKGITGGKTEGFGTEGDVKGFGNVDATAFEVPKNDRDPNADKQSIADGDINASVADFTTTLENGSGTAGGHAKLEFKNVWSNKFGKGSLRVKADQTGEGTAISLSKVSTDPEGFFDSLDGDRVFNDALILLLIEPDELGTPIFDNPAEHRSGEFSMEVSVSGDFFDGQVYHLEASISGADLPGANATVALGWELFLVEDINASDIQDSADFQSSGITAAEFEGALGDYISTPVGTGFGGATEFFGVWFVMRDIDPDLLTDWTWDSSLEGGVTAVPEFCNVNADCDDGDACTGVEVCDPGTNTCIKGTSVHCDDDLICTVDTCDPETGLCSHEPESCEGDANCDGAVDPLDSGFVLARFGCPVNTGDPSCDAADVNLDGAVDPLDSGFVLARFGTCE